MSIFVPAPPIEIVDDFVASLWRNRPILVNLVLLAELNRSKVIVLRLVKVRQIPVEPYIFEGHVVPFVRVWIVGHLIVVDVFAAEPRARHPHQLLLVHFGWPRALVFVGGRDPATMQNNGRPFNRDGVFAMESLSERNLAALITVQRVYYVVAVSHHAIVDLLFWNEDFFVVVDLSGEEVRLESLVDVVFFFGHAPPSEVHLFPGGAIGDYLIKFVVTLRAEESFSQVVAVLEVAHGAEGHATGDTAQVEGRSLRIIHSLYQISC